MLTHSVFFKLKDGSAEARQRLLDACNSYLRPIEGIEFFAAGELVADLARPVNDLEFDVALHVMFTDRAAHDVYQTADAHNQFIAEQKENWDVIRVFDANA